MSDDVRSDTHSKYLLQTETRLHSWKRDLFAVAGVVMYSSLCCAYTIKSAWCSFVMNASLKVLSHTIKWCTMT